MLAMATRYWFQKRRRIGFWAIQSQGGRPTRRACRRKSQIKRLRSSQGFAEDSRMAHFRHS